MAATRPSGSEARSLIRGWYEAGLRAVDPRAAVQQALSLNGSSLDVAGTSFDLAGTARLVAIAFGKAAVEMTSGLTGIIGKRITDGIILTKDGHAGNPPHGWDVYEASHPVPDERGVRATTAILDLAGNLREGDLAIVLVSGGGSALLEAPREPLTLADIQETTRLLLNAGAPIQHVNAVRSELSRVKGGGLRRSMGEATCVSLILSDVLGNDPTVIASGPTIARTPDRAHAIELLETYNLANRVPEAVLTVLRETHEELGYVDAPGDQFVVVGDNDLFIEEISRAVSQDGLNQRIGLRLAEGEARDLAAAFLQLCEGQPPEVDVVIGGGEATVTVRGDGIGGRNTEFALAAAIALHERHLDWVVASLASDGQDGSIDAAGAIADRFTVARGLEMGLDARAYLENNDSGEYFRRLGLLVEPGPTGTNVNDMYVAVRAEGPAGAERL